MQQYRRSTSSLGGWLIVGFIVLASLSIAAVAFTVFNVKVVKTVPTEQKEKPSVKNAQAIQQKTDKEKELEQIKRQQEKCVEVNYRHPKG